MQIVIALDTLKKQGYKVYPTNSVMDLIMTRYDSYGTRLENLKWRFRMKLGGHESILELNQNLTKVLMYNRVHTFSVSNHLTPMALQATGNMLETRHYNQYNLKQSLVIQFFQSTIR